MHATTFTLIEHGDGHARLHILKDNREIDDIKMNYKANDNSEGMRSQTQLRCHFFEWFSFS